MTTRSLFDRVTGRYQLTVGSYRLRKKENDNFSKNKPWDDDALTRRLVGTKLTNLVKGIDGSFVISIEGEYGEGKTFFLKNWQKDLERSGIITAYFNSWESDYGSEPFLAFLSTFLDAVEQYKSKKAGKEPRKFNVISKEFSKQLLLKGGPILIKGVLRHLLGDNGVEEVKDVFDNKTENEFAKDIGDGIGKAINDYHEKQQSIEIFKKTITEIVSDITEEVEDKNCKKIVILVDELDRCKPTYAVKVFEAIKHFFEVEGIIFVLGMHEKQVSNSMKVIYGEQLDTTEYLRRFIHWRFKLPSPNPHAYASYLCEKFDLQKAVIFNVDELNSKSDEPSTTDDEENNNNRDTYGHLVGCFGIFSQIFSLTLRQQEQAFTFLDVYIRTLTKTENLHALPLSIFHQIWFQRDKWVDDKNGITWGNLVEEALGHKGEINIEKVNVIFEKIMEMIELKAKEGTQHYDDFLDKQNPFFGMFFAWFSPPKMYLEIGKQWEEGENNKEIRNAFYDEIEIYHGVEWSEDNDHFFWEKEALNKDGIGEQSIANFIWNRFKEINNIQFNFRNYSESKKHDISNDDLLDIPAFLRRQAN